MSNIKGGDASTRRLSNKKPGREVKNPQADLHAISRVSLSQMVGLVEAVDEMGGDADAAAIAEEVEMDLASLGPVVDASELLGLLVIDGGNLRTTDLSRRVLGASLKERKALFRDIICQVPAFRDVVEMARAAGRPLTKDEVVDALAERFGTHRSDEFFRALVYWGRYVELVRYDSESERFSLLGPQK